MFKENFPLLLQHSTLCLAKFIKRSFSLALTLFNKVLQRMNANSLSNLMCILDQYLDERCISWSHRMWILLVILFALAVEASTSTTDWRLKKWGSPRCTFCALWDGKSAQQIIFLYLVSDITLSFNRTFSVHQLTLDITELTTGQPKVNITEYSLELFAQVAIVLIRLQMIGGRYQKYSLSLTLTSCG